MRKGFLFPRAPEMFVLLLALTMLSCSADSTGRRDRAALEGGGGALKSSKTGRQVNLAEKCGSTGRNSRQADRRSG